MRARQKSAFESAAMFVRAAYCRGPQWKLSRRYNSELSKAFPNGLVFGTKFVGYELALHGATSLNK